MTAIPTRRGDVDDPRIVEALDAILDVLRDIRDRLPAPGAASLTADDRFGRLWAAIEEDVGGLDNRFDTAEILKGAKLNAKLADALALCGITSESSTDALGMLFRHRSDRAYAGRRLVRDGRAWRLVGT
jgi:hypothetical protein